MSSGAPDIFSVVELEAGSRCNRRCSYCPVALDPRPAVPVKMPEGVFQALVDQLAEISFAGRLSYHFYNEPLLRKDLDRLVARVDARLPSALQVLYTNGDLLDDRRYTQLRNAGVDYFIVTLHSGGEFPERPFQLVQRPEELVLTNRGGVLHHLPTPTASMRDTPCFVPSEILIVSVTGDILFCYEDARRQHVMGNILESSVTDIWRSKRFVELRRDLAQGNRSVLKMCSSCTNVAHARPGLSMIEEPFRNARVPLSSTVTSLKRRSVEARLAQTAR